MKFLIVLLCTTLALSVHLHRRKFFKFSIQPGQILVHNPSDNLIALDSILRAMQPAIFRANLTSSQVAPKSNNLSQYVLNYEIKTPEENSSWTITALAYQENVSKEDEGNEQSENEKEPTYYYEEVFIKKIQGKSHISGKEMQYDGSSTTVMDQTNWEKGAQKRQKKRQKLKELLLQLQDPDFPFFQEPFEEHQLKPQRLARSLFKHRLAK